MINNKLKEKKPILAELRAIRDGISNEIKGKTPDQIVDYLKNKNTLHPSVIWEKQA